MKKCCRCKEEKDLIDFNKDKRFKDQLRPFCRECSKKEWLNRYKKNKSKESERKSIYYQKNKEAILEKCSIWLKNNRPYGSAKTAKRKSIILSATPSWLTKIHFSQIEWYYRAAEMLTNDTGIKHEVDHIHPLQGKFFSGLHVPWNLRVINFSENRSKGNKPPIFEQPLFWSVE